MDRRRFLAETANAIAALGLGADTVNAQEKYSAKSASSEQALPRQAKPNVLVIMSDQHKRNCMGAAGDSVAITPHLDQLAKESVRFSSAYCSNPICAPSRASILTGMYSHSLGSLGNQTPFSSRHKTVAQHFNRAGYFTGLIGKMHFVDAQSHGFGYQLEFNDWFQSLGPKASIYSDEVGHVDSGAGLPQIERLWEGRGDPWKGTRNQDGRKGLISVGAVSKLEEDEHFENFIARESIRFLENYGQGDEPFFLVASFLKPHEPFMPAKRFAEMFQAEKMTLSPTWGKADVDSLPRSVLHSIDVCDQTPELKAASAARERMAYYYGSVAQMDDCAGQILATLRRLGLDRNTIVVYTADHGDMLGDLGLWGKTYFYEGSCGVPLMIRMPDRDPGVCDMPVSLVSLSPTLGDLCNVPFPESDGKSFGDLVRRPDSDFKYGPVFAEFALGTKNAKYMIRKDNYKYTFWSNDKPELYDLRADPEEMHNLAVQPDHQHVVAQLKRELFAWHRPLQDL